MENFQNEEAMPIKKEEEIRADIITEYGFEEGDERIDKLVAKEMEHSKKLSDAIGQKIKHRKEAEELRAKAVTPPKDAPKEPPKEGMSLKDIRALQDVHDDDVDFVTNWAKANNTDIATARKNKDVQYILNGHAEERRTAEAANTGGSRRTTSNVSDESLIADAMEGKFPETEEGVRRLAEARMNLKKKNLK